MKRVLDHLREHGPHTVEDLARELGLKESTVAGALWEWKRLALVANPTRWVWEAIEAR